MADIGSIVGAVGSLLTGGSVTLGSVTFTGFEIPSSIDFGGDTIVVVHKLPGGLRIIDVMGDDPATPQWSGAFSGSGAASRARQVNAMRLAGAPVQLAFGPFQVQVIITHFVAKYQRVGAWIPYDISLVVVPPQPGATAPGGAALSGLIGTDAASALNSVASAAGQVADVATSAISQATSILARVTPILNLAGVNTNGITNLLNTGSGIVSGVSSLAQAPAAAASAITTFQSAGSSISAGLATIGNGIAAITTTAAAAPGGDPVSSINDLSNAGALTGAAANMAQAAGPAARAAINAGTVTAGGAT